MVCSAAARLHVWRSSITCSLAAALQTVRYERVLAFEGQRNDDGMMYEYRKLCERGQFELRKKRSRLGRPLHAPPHSRGGGMFMITGACFEHACLIVPETRREGFATEWLKVLKDGAGGEAVAWVVLPNHYHALWKGNIDALRGQLARLHNGTSTRWNREDGQEGRKAWHQFSDRRIRGEAHYYATINYIHGNPVKHGWVSRADEWSTSSLHEWLKAYGRQHLAELWVKYPVKEMGEGWDD